MTLGATNKLSHTILTRILDLVSKSLYHKILKTVHNRSLSSKRATAKTFSKKKNQVTSVYHIFCPFLLLIVLLSIQRRSFCFLPDSRNEKDTYYNSQTKHDYKNNETFKQLSFPKILGTQSDFLSKGWQKRNWIYWIGTKNWYIWIRKVFTFFLSLSSDSKCCALLFAVNLSCSSWATSCFCSSSDCLWNIKIRSYTSKKQFKTFSLQNLILKKIGW